MNIYTDEFIKFIDKAENVLAEEYNKMQVEFGSDLMIEARNLSIGDTNKFGEDYYISTEVHVLEVKDELLFLSRKSEDEVIRMLVKAFKKDVRTKVEDKLNSTDTEIKHISDVRKILKMVIDNDVIIYTDGFKMSYRLGLGFHKDKKSYTV